MRTLIAQFRLDFGRLVNRRNILILVLFLVIALYFVNTGIYEYRRMQAEVDRFEELEHLRREYHLLGRDSGTYRLRWLTYPPPVGIFFASPGTLRPIRTNLDPLQDIEIYTPLLDGSAFDSLNAGFMNYSGFLLYFGSLLFLLIGFRTYGHREYTRFITALSGTFYPIQFAPIFTGVILSWATAVFTAVCAWYWAAFNGISFSAHDYASFFDITVSTILLYLFFFTIGMFFSTIRSRSKGLGALFTAWIILLFIIPAALGKTISGQAHDTLSTYRFEKKRFLQSLAIEKAGEITASAEEEAAIVKKIMDDVDDLEARFQHNLTGFFTKYLHLAAYVPTTHYLSQTREAGGCGLFSIHDAYMHTRSLRLYYTRKKLADPGFKPAADLEPYSETFASRLPMTTMKGRYILYLWLAIAGFICVFRSRFSVLGSHFGFYPISRDIEITAAAGDKRLFKAPEKFARLFFNRLAGGFRLYQGPLRLGGQDIPAQPSKSIPFIYLMSPRCLPGDLKVGSLLAYLRAIGPLPKKQGREIADALTAIKRKRFVDLPNDKAAHVLLDLVRFMACDLYVLRDFVKDVDSKKVSGLDERLEKLVQEGAALLYFHTDPLSDPPLRFRRCDVISHDREGRYRIARK